MMVSRIGTLATVLTLTLGIAACGTSTNPKMQIPGATGKKAGAVTSNKPIDNGGEMPGDKPVDHPANVVEPSVESAKITKANFDKIKLEMTLDEVRAILGSPSAEKKIEEGQASEVTWQVGKKNITATFRDGKLKVIANDRLDEK